ncbi:MAG: phasin family protein [Pseudomonadota bacterium]
MTNVQAQLAEFNQSAIQAAIHFTNLSVENVERLVYLNLESARSVIEESAEQAKALAEVKDVQELAALRAKAAEASFEKALAYSRSLYDLANETQAKIVQLMEEQFNVFNQNVVSAVETASRSAPAGAEVAVAAVKSSMAATNAAVDSFKRAAQQAASMTDGAVQTAQRATGNPVAKIGKRENDNKKN